MKTTFPSIIGRPIELTVVALLSLCWALALFDITGIDYLMPFIAPNLKLNNTQIGLIFSLYYIPFGLSSYVTGVLTDRFGNRRILLIGVMLLFSVVSVLPGLATSLTTLLMTRMLMGLLGGPILPLAQTFVAVEMPAERRATNMGIVQNLASGMLGFLTPLVSVALAVRWGWRAGFFAILVPGLICTALISLSLRRIPKPPVALQSEDGSAAELRRKTIREAMRHRNIWLCIIGACLFTAFTLISRGYLPLFYVRLRHLTPHRMSLLMTALSVSGLILGVAFPVLADRIGRKSTAIMASLLGAILPLAALYYAGPDIGLGILMFIGWAPAGASILLFATIPSETVPKHATSTAIGLTFAISTLIGGLLGPAAAGWSADRWGLRSSLVLDAGCAIAMAIVCLGLRETRSAKSG